MSTTTPYRINIIHRDKETEVVLEINKGSLSTSSLPQTYGILQKELPHIFASQCFNKEDLPFRKEVLNTETGHLFEHILLEYLSAEKLKSGFRIATYSGETCWDWKKELRGTFHIKVSAGRQEKDLFYRALTSSLSLFKKIMWSFEAEYEYSGVNPYKQKLNSQKLSLAM
ncbi:MAG: hypothetical protein ACOX6N_03860 [Patescibacteria group bacterium]|jgi:hypothetical protein